jgi:hypothetical protein
MLKEEREGLTSRRRHTYIRNLTLLRDSRSFRKVKEEKRISPLINVNIVTRWDILLRIVQLEEKNTRREITKDTMPMQLKKMSHPQRLLKKRLKTMSYSLPSQD